MCNALKPFFELSCHRNEYIEINHIYLITVWINEAHYYYGLNELTLSFYFMLRHDNTKRFVAKKKNNVTV